MKKSSSHNIKPFSVLIHESWNLFKKNWKTLLITALVYFLTQALLSSLQKGLSQSDSHSGGVIGLLSWVVSTIMTIGWLKIYLALTRKNKVHIDDLFKHYSLFFKYFFGTALTAIIVVLGYILLIVPGIILSLKLIFVPYLLVDKKMGIIDSLKESSRITQGIKGKLFLYMIGLLGINILGLLALGIGVLVTIPITGFASALLYEGAIKNTDK